VAACLLAASRFLATSKQAACPQSGWLPVELTGLGEIAKEPWLPVELTGLGEIAEEPELRLHLSHGRGCRDPLQRGNATWTCRPAAKDAPICVGGHLHQKRKRLQNAGEQQKRNAESQMEQLSSMSSMS